MTYEEIKNAIESDEWDNYTDRVDVDHMISLFEYGILRDPKTSECVFNNFITNEEPDDDKEIEKMMIEAEYLYKEGYLTDLEYNTTTDIELIKEIYSSSETLHEQLYL